MTQHTYTAMHLERLTRTFARTYRAYFARPDLLSPANDEQLYWLARSLGHEGRILLGEHRA